MDTIAIPYIYWGAGLIVVLLFIYVAQQKIILKLQKEIDDVTLKFQFQVNLPKTLNSELLAAYPYPLCMVDPLGKITFANKGFQHLVKSSRLESLLDFDAHFHTSLGYILTEPQESTYDHITVRLANEPDKWRRFAVLSWPITSKYKLPGKVIAFHEQTHATYRKLTQSVFEQQLISYLGTITLQLKQLFPYTSKMFPNKRASLELVIEEVDIISDYLQTIHPQLRHIPTLEAVDLVSVVKKTLAAMRNPSKVKHLQWTSSLPSQCLVRATVADLSLACEALFSACMALAEDQDRLKVQVISIGKQLRLEISSPKTKLSEKESNALLHFGQPQAENTPSNFSLARVQLAACQELVHKFEGKCSISSNSSFGTVYSITLAVAEKAKRR